MVRTVYRVEHRELTEQRTHGAAIPNVFHCNRPSRHERFKDRVLGVSAMVVQMEIHICTFQKILTRPLALCADRAGAPVKLPQEHQIARRTQKGLAGWSS
jgi:hypothetical protein